MVNEGPVPTSLGGLKLLHQRGELITRRNFITICP